MRTCFILSGACVNGVWGHPPARSGLGYHSTRKLVLDGCDRWLIGACFLSIDYINVRNLE